MTILILRLSLLVTCTALLHNKETSPTELRIQYGVQDINEEFKFVVLLAADVVVTNTTKLIGFCSGSMITERKVLTARNCRRDNTKAVYAIQNATAKNYIIRPVLKYIEHPFKNVNLMLLVTQTFRGIPTVGISAVDAKSLMGHPVKFAGYGAKNLIQVLKSESNKNSPSSLNELTQSNNPNAVYGDYRDDTMTVGEGVLMPCKKEDMRHIVGNVYVSCVAVKCENKFQIPLPGDFGGPILHGGKLVGIASMIVPLESPLIIMQLSPYMRWIMKTVAANKNTDNTDSLC